MMIFISFTFSCLIGFVVALPAQSPVIRKLEPGLRYQYAIDSKGENHLVDLWMTLDDLRQAERFNPVTANAYHLFTRANPTTSQPLVPNNAATLQQSNFDGKKRTVLLVHGWRDSALSELNSVIVPALLDAADLNVIVVDWSSGASSINFRLVILNTISSGNAVAQFITWLNQASGSDTSQLHLIGHGFGGHQVGIIGRNLGGTVNYITGLNPALIGWVTNIYRFQPNDGVYTEVIHTNYGVYGYIAELAQVDFYPNGGISMPGCDSNECDHARSYFYFAESVRSGGFNGRQCVNYAAAVIGMCDILPGKLHMGGLEPKIGRSGVYLLETNASPPFSRD
ncbi:unnamed protein product [Diatraea saccharalis]|uniref:Lipase domain-containing protein n=1 Tax=Diatraea saccharalis TaxID=40085 RepID=A0A9N9RHA5_9NEOP|nr:unnamed protein product [Diatraea saccharalis]